MELAPQPTTEEVYVAHQPYKDVSAGKPFALSAKIVGVDTTAKVSLVANSLTGEWKTVPMQQNSPYI